MTANLWYEFMLKMVDEFGVRSSLDNVDENNSLEDEGLWFECPCCGEPILESDFSYAEISEYCPVCEQNYDEC